MVFIIQEILKTNKRILNTNIAAKVNAWKNNYYEKYYQ